MGVLGVAALLAAGLLVVPSAQAAGIKYSFVARGTITDVDEAAKTIKVDVEKVDGRGKGDMEGENIEFQVGAAKVVKVASGKDKPVTYHNLAIGQQVGMKGIAKDDSDDTFVTSFVRIQNRDFTVIGLMESLDKSAKTTKISVITSTYKPTVYKKGTNITMTYTNDTTFYENNAERDIADINADAQRVKITGTIKNTNTWQISKLWNKHKGN